MTLDGDGLEILSADACLELLRSRSFGRIGLSASALPVVLPVNYEVVGDLIVIRTRRGTKLAAATRNAIVAFEVDEIDAASGAGWSVMVQGLARESTPAIAAGLGDTPALARWLDPIRSRHFSISMDLISGRRLLAAGMK